eukprot:TRINITY_DN63_c0_g1_i14.p1 TRINITY_DN63_c0_g1~~TRINITY_DN63_c0_g1_i14.p1  ORF type:complete len:310 (-),score=65.81 TRINITY_DN63_c0_g1_i14:10-939(-)
MSPSVQTLFLWRNNPTVVIGKHQNPWKECHLQQMEDLGVTLVRRQSGGGSVYQDLGNSCFTFLSSRNAFDIDRNTQIIIDALNTKFNIQAQKSGRNDITVGEKKISGSAFKKSLDRSFHHGTLLVDVDLDNLQKFLNPSKAKLQSKGVDSVKARVLNLKEINPSINHDTLSQALVEQFFDTYQDTCEIKDLDTQELQSIPKIKEYYEKLIDWDWRYGKTPEFTHHVETRFPWGIMDVYVVSKKAIITDCKIYSDSLSPLMIETITEELKGQPYNKEGIERACTETKKKLQDPVVGPQLDEFCAWFSSQL